MFKITKKETPNYIVKLIPESKQIIRTNKNHIPSCNCITDCFKYSFFPSTLNDWFNLNENIRNSELILVFKSKLLSFNPPVQNDMYNIFYLKGPKFLTCLRLGVSHLN